MRIRGVVSVGLACVLAVAAPPAPAQQPLMPVSASGKTVTPVFEGWYVNPDGRRELLSAVNNFQWNWHVNYIYSDDVAPLLPKGTVLAFTAWHDNTAANRNNPDPTQWVGWGDRTVDEMAHCWIDVTYLEQDEFDKLVADRKAKAPRKVQP